MYTERGARSTVFSAHFARFSGGQEPAARTCISFLFRVTCGGSMAAGSGGRWHGGREHSAICGQGAGPERSIGVGHARVLPRPDLAKRAPAGVGAGSSKQLIEAEHPEAQQADERKDEDGGVPTGKERCGMHATSETKQGMRLFSSFSPVIGLDWRLLRIRSNGLKQG